MKFKFDKTVVKKFKLGSEPKDHQYWLNQSPETRIESIELLRREYYGEDAFKSGLQRVIELLNKHKVRFIIVGAYAVGFHGYVRNTGDLDVWIDTDNNNAERVLQALHDFGFSSLDIKLEDLTRKDFVIQLGVPPHRLDLLTSVIALDFNTCYLKIQKTVIDGVELPFLDLESLKINKRSTGRHKDLADVENLP